jgi:hypothetical protein
MTLLIFAMRFAALIQLVIAAANLTVARRLEYKANLRHATPIVRQIFAVHAAYIVAVILWFALLSFLFAPQLASGDPLMRFIDFGLGAFWGMRAILQLAIYDKGVRRRYRGEDVAFLLACVTLAGIFLRGGLL